MLVYKIHDYFYHNTFFLCVNTGLILCKDTMLNDFFNAKEMLICLKQLNLQSLLRFEHSFIVTMFHLFEQPLCATPPARFTYPFAYSPHPLVAQAAEQMRAYVQQQTAWCEELAGGKMLGVMVVERSDGEVGFLAAYSGLLQGRNDMPYFVPAVYDFLHPESYFIEQEAYISNLNREVERLENSAEYTEAKANYLVAQQAAESAIADFRKQMLHAKANREECRRIGGLTAEELQNLVRESQFQKGELNRLKQHHRRVVEDAWQTYTTLSHRIDQLKDLRRKSSDALQQWIFQQFKMLNAHGEAQDLMQIFKSTPAGVPPAGAGECALPKMLQYAYLHQLRPLCFGEFWWGASPKKEVRRHGQFYPSCSGKCKPILAHMLQGLMVDENPLANAESTPSEWLPIVFEDASLIVVNKPAGMLSVPGTTAAVSALEILQRERSEVLVVHRLDMATSGLLVFAKNKAAHYELQRQFAERETKKHYVALLDGVGVPSDGFVRLPLRADLLDRPRQVVDKEEGKPAVTHFRKISEEILDGRHVTRMLLSPLTGRTHQLRVHCAHSDGLNLPIIGDALYGTASARLYLHAEQLFLKHPESRQTLRFKATPDF